MGEIGSSLVAVVLVMASVFIPAAFLPGTTGQLYKQFAITIVISVSVSGFVALTLTPAMCGAAAAGEHVAPQRGFFAWFNHEVDRLTRGLRPRRGVGHQAHGGGFVLLAVFLCCIWHLFATLPTSFVPQEDQGYALVAFIMPDAASLERTQRRRRAGGRDPGEDSRRSTPRTMITGYSLVDGGFKTNAATFFVTFKDFKERYATLATAKAQNARAILTTLYARPRRSRAPW